MTFYIYSHEPIEDALKRIARERLEQSIETLQTLPNGQQKAVHDTRKNFKRVRAVLRLMRDALGEAQFKEQNALFRDASRLLAPIRDSAVMVETLDGIKSADAEFVEIRQALVERHEAISHTLLGKQRVIGQVIEQIENGRSTIQAVSVQPNSFKTVEPSLRRVYARGYKRMRHAYQVGDNSEAFHNWRKRVKYLWYHLEILRPIWPSLCAVLIKDLHHLSDYLGDAHDMAELSHLLHSEPERFTDSSVVRQLLNRLQVRQDALIKEALSLGSRLFADKPRQFTSRIGSYWAVWQEDVAEKRPFIQQPVDLQAEEKKANLLLTTRDAAEALGLPVETVRKFIENGRLPATKVGNRWIVRQRSLANLASTNQK